MRDDELIMLRRIISLAIVCAGLLLAGLPAVACRPNVPLEDCCPSGPGGPCRAPGGFTSQAQVVCCAGGIITPAATASLSLLHDRDNPHSTASNPPAALVAVSFNTAISWRASAAPVGDEAPAYRPSGSVLYLSTGRLRL